MGFEMPVDVDYFDHPKTLRLIALLGRQEGDTYPLRLWKWAAKYCKKGNLSGDPGQIEVAVRWKGPPGRLQKALIEAGFIEPDGKAIHGWMEGIGRAILIYDEKKRKQREKYALAHGILPEECSNKHPYPGGEGRGGDTQEGIGNPGGEDAPPPVEVPEATDKDVIDAVHAWDPTFPEKEIRTQITRAGKLGISKDRLMADVKSLGERLRIWSIVDTYQYPAKNGSITKARENSPTSKPTVLQTNREEVQRKQDDARKRADQVLADLPPDELKAWTTEAEETAERANIPAPGRKLFIQAELRKRAAKQFSIEGV